MEISETMKYNIKYNLFVDVDGNIYWRDQYGNINPKSQRVGKNGYKFIECGRLKKRIRVHRIVAETFIPNPDNKPEVDHINRIRTDNRVENLHWVTRLENAQNRGPRKSGYKCKKHKKHKKHIFTEPHSEFGKLFFETFGIMRADDPKFYNRMRARYQYHGRL